MLDKRQIVSGALTSLCPVLSTQNQIAVFLWNTMGGLDLTAFPLLVAIYDIQDPAAMLDRLVVIRDHLKSDANN